MSYLEGKRILLTGAAGGMGEHYIRQMLTAGCHLVLTDLSADNLEQKVKAIKSSLAGTPGELLGLFASDLSSAEGCRDAYAKCLQITPGIDILINNAGIITYGDFHDVPAVKWQALINLNLLAPMHLTHLFLPSMLERSAGHIVFMCSVAGFVGTARGTPYSCSKFALRGFGMCLNKEIRKKGVYTTVIYPSWVKTTLLNSPEYGKEPVAKLPGILAENPERVVRGALRGISRKKLHVYPGLFAKGVYFASKFTPIVSNQAH